MYFLSLSTFWLKPGKPVSTVMGITSNLIGKVAYKSNNK